VSALTAAYDVAVNAAGRSGLDILINRSIQWNDGAASPQSTPQEKAVLELRLEPFSQASFGFSPRADQLPTVTNILVHGSQATDDACAFSDVDILVILDDRHQFARNDHVKAIRELRRLLASIYEFDTLMHHGLMLLPASALDAYDERFLPVETLRVSKVLAGPLSLALSPAPHDKTGSVKRIHAAAESITMQMGRRIHRRGDYQLKNLVSGILLLPALFLASKSHFVYKRESFELARPYFSAAAWNFIASAEQIRRDWIKPQYPWWKNATVAIGHPRSRTLLSEAIPTRLNLKRPSQDAAIRQLEQAASEFLAELKTAVGNPPANPR
jgi:predicted nucleotidyltransferase